MKDLIKSIKQQKINCATESGFVFVLNFDVEWRKGGYATMQPFIAIENENLSEEYYRFQQEAWGHYEHFQPDKSEMYQMMFKIPSVNYGDNYYGEHQLSTAIEQYKVAFKHKCLEDFKDIKSVPELRDYLFDDRLIGGPARSFFEMYLASKYMSREEFLMIKHNDSKASQEAQKFFLERIYGDKSGN